MVQREEKGVDVMEDRIEEINLYDYYKIIVKRKNIIILIVLIASILSFAISYLSPKVYESESIIRVPLIADSEANTPLISISEVKLLIENLEQSLKQRNFEKFDGGVNRQVIDLKIFNIESSENSFKLVVQTKTNSRMAVEASNKTVSYLQDNDFVKSKINKEKKILTNKLSKTKTTLEKAIKIKNDSIALLESRNPVGFNPVDLQVEINSLENQIIDLEEELESLKGFEFINKPYASSKPVKPKPLLSTILGFFVSLFFGIFVTFFIEWLDKNKRSEL